MKGRDEDRWTFQPGYLPHDEAVEVARRAKLDILRRILERDRPTATASIYERLNWLLRVVEFEEMSSTALLQSLQERSRLMDDTLYGPPPIALNVRDLRLMGDHPLGDALRILREDRKLTMRELAKLMGVSAPFWCDYEHGHRVPTPQRIRQAAEILKTNPDDLLFRRTMVTFDEWADQAKIDPKLRDGLLAMLRRAARRRR